MRALVGLGLSVAEGGCRLCFQKRVSEKRPRGTASELLQKGQPCSNREVIIVNLTCVTAKKPARAHTHLSQSCATHTDHAVSSARCPANR